jgi:hypothetical protein
MSTASVWDADKKKLIPIDCLPIELHYNASGLVAYVEATDFDGIVYRQTFTRDAGGRVTNITGWVKQ